MPVFNKLVLDQDGLLVGKRQIDASQDGVYFSGNGMFGDNLVVTGNTTANVFSGSGASLTSLNGTNISSGTISRSRLPAGSVLQVVDTYFTTPVSQSMTGAAVNNITGLQATIQPTSTSSRILIFVRCFGEHGTDGMNWESMFGITRDGTAIGLPAQPGSNLLGMSMASLSHYSANADSTPENVFYNYIDSPGTTSTVTYRAYYTPQSTETLYTNRTVNAATTVGFERGTSSIILMEIAG